MKDARIIHLLKKSGACISGYKEALEFSTPEEAWAGLPVISLVWWLGFCRVPVDKLFADLWMTEGIIHAAEETRVVDMDGREDEEFLHSALVSGEYNEYTHRDDEVCNYENLDGIMQALIYKYYPEPTYPND